MFYNSGENVNGGMTITIGKDVVRVPNYLFVPESNEGDDGTSPNVKELVFEDGGIIQEIGERSFSNFVNVESLTIPATVKKICGYAFINYKNLTSLKFATGSQLEIICKIAFYNCLKLTKVVFPVGLKTIEASAFYCYTPTPGSIAIVVIPSSVEYVGSTAFHNHTKASFYLQSESVPELWEKNWNNLYRPVHLGVDISNI